MAEHPPIDREALARQLRARMQQQRPRRSRLILLLLVPAWIMAAAAIWWLWHRSEPPRLNVIAFDQLAPPGSKFPMTAWLIPEDPRETAGNLGGLDVYFEAIPPEPGKTGQPAKVSSQRSGRIDLTCDPFGVGIEEFKISYASSTLRYRTEDRARAFVWPKDQRPVLFVEVNAVAVTDPGSWQASRFRGIVPRESADKALKALHAKDYRLVYLAGSAAAPMQYRLMRGWVETKTGEGGSFPDGPVLGLLSAEGTSPAARDWSATIKEALAGRGGSMGVARDPQLAEVFRDAGLKTFVLAEAAEAPAGITRLAGWGDLIPDEKKDGKAEKRKD